MQGRRRLSVTEWMQKGRMMVRRSKGDKHQSAPGVVLLYPTFLWTCSPGNELGEGKEMSSCLPVWGKLIKHVLWELELCLALCRVWFLRSLICSTILWLVVDRTLTVIL